MTQPSTNLTQLREAIENRSRKGKLTVTLDKLSYINHFYLDPIPEDNPRRDVLLIGVGSGHDVVFNLLQNNFHSALGVDPYNCRRRE